MARSPPGPARQRRRARRVPAPADPACGARAGRLTMLLDRPAQHIAGDLVELLVALAVEKPQLLLLVHDPSGLDAVALCQTLRAASEVPILVLISRLDRCDLTYALWAGADDALPFPLAPAQLRARIAALLRRHWPCVPDRHKQTVACGEGASTRRCYIFSN